MRLIRKKSKQTYVNKKGEVKNYYNYYIYDNNIVVQIKASFKDDNKLLFALAQYVDDDEK